MDVCGIRLDGIEQTIFDRAVERGEMVIEPSLPASSPVPEAYRRWCAANGREHRESESPALLYWRKLYGELDDREKRNYR